MSLILQETLKSLCHKNEWCYAVFWKLKRHSRMMLTWEDGYYEFAKPSLASNDYSCIKSLSDEFETGGSSHHHSVFGREFFSMEDKIGLAVAKMSYQIHSLGEGIVGHVAFTGKHHWVIRQKNCIDKSNSISMPTRPLLEYPDGWQNQFESGIKTIAVVAIVPHGVVQLGSMKMVFNKDSIVLPRDNLEGCASWALELSDQTMGCPIIVENLTQHRQMLVEMLCEEQGLFLEIADIIQGLGLTILKGIIEARNEKIWSHFIVEANRDVHRVEILWSLLQLLQPNSNNRPKTCIQPILPRPRGIDSYSQTGNMH